MCTCLAKTILNLGSCILGPRLNPMVACLCHFVISFFRLFAWRYGAAPRRNNAKRKDENTPSEITKRRNNARRKDEKTKCATRNDEKRARKDEKTPCEITPFSTLIFRLFAWRLFAVSSFRLALFRLFVISRGVFSLFRLFAWRYFVFSPRHNAKRKDEKTPCEKTK